MFTKNKTPDTPSSTTTPQPNLPGSDAIKPASTKPTAKAAPSIISADMVITGSIATAGEIQIDGKVEGDVRASALTVGNGGEILGEVAAEVIVVRGKINGALKGRKIQLASGAKVEGDIWHTSLAIEANSIFEGQVRYVQDPLNQTATATPSKAATTSSAGSTPKISGTTSAATATPPPTTN